ncbi:MAG: hypothetical protein DELT_01840 [Desulfovibrio sp.]
MADGFFRRVWAKRSVSSSILGAVVVFIVLGLYLGEPLFLRQLDNRIYDVYLTSRPKIEPSPVPVIIDIDEDSLAKYGQWPWPRYRLATLIQNATDRGAAAIALDMLLAEPDRSSPEAIRDSLHKDLGLDVGFSGLPPALADYDALLAATIANCPVVLGMYARFDGKGGVVERFPGGVSVAEQKGAEGVSYKSRVHKANGVTMPLEKLLQAAPPGFINVSPDSDGFVRRIPAIVTAGDTAYVNLAVRAFMVALGRKSLIAKSGPDGLEKIRIGQYELPVSPEGDFIVPFTGPRQEYQYVSAAAVLEGTLPDDAFNGRILFVGTSAPGLLDIRATPYDRVYPGVEVHAAVLDALVTGRSLSVPSWTPGLQVLAIIGLGIFSGVAFTLAKPKVYSLVGALLVFGVIFGCWRLFVAGYFVSPLYAVLTVTCQAAMLVMLRFWLEERQKLILRQAFSRYVAPEVVKRITEHEGDLFAGEERELSIMFTDIRSFTSMSERLDPRQVVTLLNRYFTPMTGLVRDNAGTLDKFIGDALMAFWNAPLPVENHPVLAVETALQMHEALAELNTDIEAEFGCTIHMGAGIHTGKVYVGNMGSDDLVNYTLIGDSVNLASRLEGLCSQFNQGIVVSSATMEYCVTREPERFFFLPLDTLRVKGREQPVSVFSVLRPEEGRRREKEFAAYAEAGALYRNGAFADAATAFTALFAAYPEVSFYALYAERAKMLRRNPPSAWDGVWTLESK